MSAAVSVVAVLGAGASLAATPAHAASPAWRISDQAVPGALPHGSHGLLNLQVENIGDSATDGSPITVTDRLPAGVTATAAGGLAYETDNAFLSGNWSCAIEPGSEENSLVTCVNDPNYNPPTGIPNTGLPVIRPTFYHGYGLNNTGCAVGSPAVCEVEEPESYHSMPPAIAIVVVLSPSLEEGTVLTDEATVSGGGSPAPATDHATIEVGEEPTPFGISGVHQWAINADGSPDTQAGSHPYAFTTAVKFNLQPAGKSGVGAGALRSVHAELPPGFVGNPDATPKCSEQAFDERLRESSTGANCPPASQVGFATITGVVGGSNSYQDVPIYNLVPYSGEPARLGLAVGQFTAFLSPSIHTGRGYNLTIDVRDIPNELQIGFADLTFWGVPPDFSHDRQRFPEGKASAFAGTSSDAPPLPFLTLPTRCGATQPLSISAEAWEGPNTDPGPLTSGPIGFFSSDEENNPVLLDGCNKLDFSPTISARPTADTADSPTGLHVDLHIPQQNGDCPAAPAECGTAEAELRDTVVTLPAGIAVDPSGANGLGACSEAQIELEGPEPATCPAASKIGTVEVDTPLVDHPLPGSVYIAEPHQNPFGSLLAIYIAVDDPETGVVVKLLGHVEADPVTGQLKATFVENPQLPFEDFKLDFFEGPTAPLKTAPTCGTFTTTSDLTPWTSPEGADAFPTDSFQIDHGAGGGACASSEGALPNKPAFTAGTAAPRAGAYSPFTLKMSREDGSQPFAGLDFTLPPGLTAKLAGIPYCPDAAIAAAEAESGAAEQASPSCPAASELGTITVGAGAGPTPFYVTGHLYLAGPYKGAPLSVISLTPAVAGPFDLGTVGDRVALQVNPETAQVHAVTDTIPHILQGIPLDVRSLAVHLSRSDFTINPTNCEKHPFTGTATSTLGNSAALTSPFQVGECSKLAFRPKLALSLTGSTKHAGHPALKAVLTYPKGGAYANVAKAQVNLPHSEFIDQGNLNKTCTKPVLLAGDCPASSIYGHAEAWTPLLAAPLEGPVYLVGGYGYKLPALVAELDGQIKVLLVGKVDSGKNHGIRNTFEAVPDAPVEKFVLEMKGGPKYSLLENSEDLCAKPQRAIANFTAQNGMVEDTKVPLKVSCPKGRKGSGHKKKAHRHGHAGRAPRGSTKSKG